MGRIRTIKPEFPQSESIGKLSRDARLLFVELWTIVDDSGRTPAASRMLASLLFPYDEDVRDLIDGWLTELEEGGHIVRYQYRGHSYLEVCDFLTYQRIDKPSPAKYPGPDGKSVKSRESSREIAQEGEAEKEKETEGNESMRPIRQETDNETTRATLLLQEIAVPYDSGTLAIARQAICLLAKEKGGIQGAAEYIRHAALAAKEKGETINRFWFADQKYLPKKKSKKNDPMANMKFVNQ